MLLLVLLLLSIITLIYLDIRQLSLEFKEWLVSWILSLRLVHLIIHLKILNWVVRVYLRGVYILFFYDHHFIKVLIHVWQLLEERLLLYECLWLKSNLKGFLRKRNFTESGDMRCWLYLRCLNYSLSRNLRCHLSLLLLNGLLRRLRGHRCWIPK